MPLNPALSQAAPWYTHRWPWLLMLGPASVLIGGAIATWLALDHPDAMVVDDYYKQGKAINQDLRRDRMATAMQLALYLRYEGGRLQGRIESFGRPLAVPFTVKLAHPTLPQRDLSLLIKPDAQGAFSIALPVLEQTHWQLVAEGNMRDWRLARSWDWPRQSTLEILADKS
ncbi:FixH family protein [Massilia norwichensis]|uniref:FixH family protein n=1 Tax=Massilia norwichensis TaxID=1442366 RepID=A0ABT2A0Y1_9BURK|nr:FixH family protein [Massilia norwichensis]MCS0587842.1 FixH family protein [Massilia norwichensis]